MIQLQNYMECVQEYIFDRSNDLLDAEGSKMEAKYDPANLALY